jgi:hypothetical protein
MPRYGNNKIYVDDSVFQKKAKKLAKKLGVDEYDFVKNQTGLLAREAAMMTPPYVSFPGLRGGTSPGTKADLVAGEDAIYNKKPGKGGGLKRIFIVVADDVANKEYRKSKGGMIYRHGRPVALGVMTNMSEMHSWHQSNRNARGRTIKAIAPHIPWVSESLFKQYAEKVQRRVGIAKASFVSASKQLEAKGGVTPKIKRHLGRASGIGFMEKTRKGPYGNIVAKADGISHTFKHLPKLESNRLKKAVKRLEYIGRQSAKKSGFKVV